MTTLSDEQFAAKAGAQALMFTPNEHSDVIEGRTSAERAGLKVYHRHVTRGPFGGASQLHRGNAASLFWRSRGKVPL